MRNGLSRKVHTLNIQHGTRDQPVEVGYIIVPNYVSFWKWHRKRAHAVLVKLQKSTALRDYGDHSESSIGGTQWEEQDGTGLGTSWHQHGVPVTAQCCYPFTPRLPEPLLSYSSSLHNSFPICQLANTKYCMRVYNILFKLPPWETTRGHMAGLVSLKHIYFLSVCDQHE